MQKLFFIIDDDPDDIQFFCEAVKEISETYQCISAANGEEALQKLSTATKKPDYIFLDLNMPRMNGKQCLAQLKLNKQLAKIPVFIYSTSKLQQDVEDAHRLGAASFLTKPNRFEDLITAISGVLAGEHASKNILN